MSEFNNNNSSYFSGTDQSQSSGQNNSDSSSSTNDSSYPTNNTSSNDQSGSYMTSSSSSSTTTDQSGASSSTTTDQSGPSYEASSSGSSSSGSDFDSHPSASNLSASKESSESAPYQQLSSSNSNASEQDDKTDKNTNSYLTQTSSTSISTPVPDNIPPTSTSISTPVPDSMPLSSSDHKMADMLPQILLFGCVLFIILMQNLAYRCRQFCLTDSSCSNSIISGLSLGYLISKVLPFLMVKVGSAHDIQDIYLKKPEHLLLATFCFFGIGFLFNYFLEKKSAKNICEDVVFPYSFYLLNCSLLCGMSFIAGYNLITFKELGLLEVLEFTVFMSVLLFVETSTLFNLFSGKNHLISKVMFSVFCLLGFLSSKMGMLSSSVLTTVLSLSVMVGFFVFSTVRVEMALVKRNSNYVAFIISFIGLCALTIIQSLYESVRC
ncbi:MAG: hypothetical protein KBD31_00805 [Proteobacteria bacterium]|nr:hypothetical protein [Pseudomonadota bacterium]